MQMTYIGFGHPRLILKPIITLACISNKLKCYFFLFCILSRRSAVLDNILHDTQHRIWCEHQILNCAKLSYDLILYWVNWMGFEYVSYCIRVPFTVFSIQAIYRVCKIGLSHNIACSFSFSIWIKKKWYFEF